MSKEQVTITLNPELVEELKSIAAKTNQSLSSVIESYLSANSLSGRTSLEKALELAEELKTEFGKEKK